MISNAVRFILELYHPGQSDGVHPSHVNVHRILLDVGACKAVTPTVIKNTVRSVNVVLYFGEYYKMIIEPPTYEYLTNVSKFLVGAIFQWSPLQLKL